MTDLQLRITFEKLEARVKQLEQALKIGAGFGDAKLEDWVKLEERARKAEAEVMRLRDMLHDAGSRHDRTVYKLQTQIDELREERDGLLEERKQRDEQAR